MIKKLLSISVASLALVACSSDIDELAPNGSDNLIELQGSINNASTRTIRPLLSGYELTANSNSKKYITGVFSGPVYTLNGEVDLVYGNNIIAKLPLSSCSLLIPCPESGETATELHGCYDFRGSFYANTTYTVNLVINGNVVKTANVTTPKDPTPPRPRPFLEDDRIIEP